MRTHTPSNTRDWSRIAHSLQIWASVRLRRNLLCHGWIAFSFFIIYILYGLVWVGYRLTFCKWSNALNTTNFLKKWRHRQTMGFWVVGSIPTIHNNKVFRFSHVELEKYPPWYPQEMKRLGYWQRSAVYPADLLSRRFRGGECYTAGLVWVSYRLTSCKWSNGLIPH